MRSVLISFLRVFIAWLLREVVSHTLLHSLFKWQLPLLCQHIDDNKRIWIELLCWTYIAMPRRHGKFMKVQLHAFVTSALSRKSTASFTLQPLRIRRKASLPLRQMIGSDAGTIHISLLGRQPWQSSWYLFRMSEQVSISSHLWTTKLYIWKNTKCLKTATFFLRRDVTFRLVNVKETKKTFKLLLLKSKTCSGVKFSTKKNTMFSSGSGVKGSKQRCQCSGCPQSANSLVWHWFNTLLSALLDTPRKTGFNESSFLCSLCAKSLIANY